MVTGNILSQSEQHDIISMVFDEGVKGLVRRYAQPPIFIKLISGGGSDRSFFRIEKQGKSIILMVSPAHDGDFRYYCEIGRFLRVSGIGAPEFYEADQAKKNLFMEDVGEENFYFKF